MKSALKPALLDGSFRARISLSPVLHQDWNYEPRDLVCAILDGLPVKETGVPSAHLPVLFPLVVFLHELRKTVGCERGEGGPGDGGKWLDLCP